MGKTFVFNLDWADILEGKSRQIRLEVYDAIMGYVRTGETPKLKEVAETCFKFIKIEIDANKAKWNDVREKRSKAAKTRYNRELPLEDDEMTDANADFASCICNNNVDNVDNVDVNVSSNEDNKEKLSIESKKKTKNCLETLKRLREESNNDSYKSFLSYVENNTPYIATHLAAPTEANFLKLKDAYGSELIVEQLQQIENRVDLRKRYSDLYRTLLNWCKKEWESRQ